MGGRGLGLFGLGQGRVGAFREDGDELPGSIQCAEFLD